MNEEQISYNPGISFITIGVKNLELMRAFYKEKLGWAAEKDEDGIAFFKMNNGLILALFPEEELAKDIGIANAPIDYKHFSLAINLPSKQEVDSFFEILLLKKISIQKMPESVFWGGYRGYFSDPENNFWEVAYNPFL
ncbi:MAG: VOC family protein [Arachidicoccus sp.]|nr:VOC family protein [Arachidicoccus sp.]